jgi:RNA polymerase sigma-70 factor (ECF subfamily)
MSAASDEQLIRAFRETGEAGAIEMLVERHIGKVRSMIYAMVLDDAAADDLTQEAFLKAVNHLGRFRSEARFSTWLYRIAVNTTRSFQRSRARRREEPLDCVPDGEDPGASPRDQVMAMEEQAVLRNALAALPAPLRSAFTLVVIQGMSPDEAARAEGCFLSTIYRRVTAARGELARRLEAHDEQRP